MKFVDLTGRKFGRFTVIRKAANRNKMSCWLCFCACGEQRVVYGGNLIKGVSTSCGCYSVELTRKRSTTHGMRSTPTYKSWANMWQRCTNPNEEQYPAYGGRGIKVCERWGRFENFLADMGARPSGHTPDRFPNKDGNYEPGNCRWATPREQSNNTRRNRWLTVNGRSQTAAQWSREMGYSRGLILERIDILGWSVEKSVNTPALKTWKRGYYQHQRFVPH